MPKREAAASAGVELSRIVSGQDHAPVVYFARIGTDYIKIGTTTNLAARMHSFYLGLRDVLLLVPGGHPTENAYHSRFRALSVGGRRRELFRFAGNLEVFLTSATSRNLAGCLSRQRDEQEPEAVPEVVPEVVPGAPVELAVVPPEAPSCVTVRQAQEAGMLPRTWTKPGGAFRTAKSRAKKAGIPVPEVKGMRGTEAAYDAIELADFLESLTTERRMA